MVPGSAPHPLGQELVLQRHGAIRDHAPSTEEQQNLIRDGLKR